MKGSDGPAAVDGEGLSARIGGRCNIDGEIGDLFRRTKAAVIGLTKSVAADYVTRGIRCNAICPGTVESPSLQDRMRAQGDYDAARAAFIARQPMGRLGSPEEIADLAVYIATATYTSGQAFAIDGGWTI